MPHRGGGGASCFRSSRSSWSPVGLRGAFTRGVRLQKARKTPARLARASGAACGHGRSGPPSRAVQATEATGPFSQENANSRGPARLPTPLDDGGKKAQQDADKAAKAEAAEKLAAQGRRAPLSRQRARRRRRLRHDRPAARPHSKRPRPKPAPLRKEDGRTRATPWALKRRPDLAPAGPLGPPRVVCRCPAIVGARGSRWSALG